jgi:hypothetical protein
VWHVISPWVAYASALVAGALLARGRIVALNLVAMSWLDLLFAGIRNAWDAAAYIATKGQVGRCSEAASVELHPVKERHSSSARMDTGIRAVTGVTGLLSWKKRMTRGREVRSRLPVGQGGECNAIAMNQRETGGIGWRPATRSMAENPEEEPLVVGKAACAPGVT